MQSFICALSLSLLPFGRPSAFYSNLINLLIYPVIILISGRAKTFVRPHCPSVGLFVCLFLYSTFILSVLRRSPPRALQTTVLCAPNRLFHCTGNRSVRRTATAQRALFHTLTLSLSIPVHGVGRCNEEQRELEVKLETQLNAETQCVKMTDTSTTSSGEFGN